MTPFVERDCIIEHEGRAFEAGGAIVTPTAIAAYVAADGVLTDWHGNSIGRWRETARWRMRSYLGSYMHQLEATVDGIVYTGRSFGVGMLYRGRAKRAKGAKA